MAELKTFGEELISDLKEGLKELKGKSNSLKRIAVKPTTSVTAPSVPKNDSAKPKSPGKNSI